MASESTGVQAPSAGDEGFALVGKGGKPISPKSAQAGGSAAPAPAYADVVAGLASSTPAHALVAAPTPASGEMTPMDGSFSPPYSHSIWLFREAEVL